MELSELRDEPLPLNDDPAKAEETLLLTTEDMTVNPIIPPRDRKKETIEVTMASQCIIRACECN